MHILDSPTPSTIVLFRPNVSNTKITVGVNYKRPFSSSSNDNDAVADWSSLGHVIVTRQRMNKWSLDLTLTVFVYFDQDNTSLSTAHVYYTSIYQDSTY